MNDQKIFDGPFDFALYFEENPDMLAAIPWGSHVIKSVKSIDKGCNCKRKTRVNNTKSIYKNIVLKIFKDNKNMTNILKKSLNVKKIIFKLDKEVIFETEDE